MGGADAGGHDNTANGDNTANRDNTATAVHAAGSPDTVVAWAPGRVNLIGDHTDYAGGLVLPMAIDLGTTVRFDRGGTHLRLRSGRRRPLSLDLPVAASVARSLSDLEPSWGRFVAAAAIEVGATVGGDGEISTTLPVGAGLSSSASLELAVALALGFDGSPLELARLGQRAEHAASGVPCGIMDQLAIAAGTTGHALLIDCATERYQPVVIPDTVEVWVLHSGVKRRLADSAYAERRAATEAAAEVVGPLAQANLDDIESIPDPVLRRRARHVRSECDRVQRFAAALATDDPTTAGELMEASHASLRDDFEVSVSQLDELVVALSARPEVFGARLTGAGFGGCVVALARPGSNLSGVGSAAWLVRASDGARQITG